MYRFFTIRIQGIEVCTGYAWNLPSEGRGVGV